MTGGAPRGDRPYATRVFDEHRDLLVGVAYRVLGSVKEAEDAVQEAWLRWSKVDSAMVDNPRVFLVRVTTRLAIDRLRRAKARRAPSKWSASAPSWRNFVELWPPRARRGLTARTRGRRWRSHGALPIKP